MSYLLLSNLFFGSAIVSVFLSFLALRLRKNSANKSLSFLFLATALWSCFYGLELISSSYSQLHTYIILEYLGIATIPVFLLIYTSIYCGRDSWLNNATVVSLFLIPVVTIVSVATNNYHHLFYLQSSIVDAGAYFFHSFEPGNLYWLHIIYSYTLIFVSVLMLSKMYIRVSTEHRTRVFIILISSIIPSFISFLYVLGIRPEGNIDLTPIGFLVMGIIMIFASINKGLLDIKPMVLNSLFESIPDAIFVLDLSGEITNTNPKAVDMLLKGDLDSSRIKMIIESDKYITNSENNVSFLEIKFDEKSYRVEKNNITDRRLRVIGTMFLIIDVTQEKRYRDALSQSEDQYKLLFENAQEAIVVIQEKRFVFFNPMLAKMTGYESSELQAMHLSQLIHPDDLHIITTIYSKIAEGDTILQKTYFRLIGKLGNICWVEFSSILIDWNGKPAGLIFVNDVNAQKQSEELKELLIKISNTYINAPIDNFSETINGSLCEMGKFVNADRSYIFDYDWVANICNNTFEWCEEGISSEMENLQEIPLDYIPQWVETHKKNAPMYVDNVQELEPESGLRQILEPQEIKSLITIPMMDNTKCIGFVGFDSVKAYHKYSDTEKDLLQVFSQMIVNLFNRKHANDLLQNQINVQRLINKISSDLVSVDNRNIDEKINRMLQEAGEFFGVDRSYILRYSQNLIIETNTHEWCAQGVRSQMETITDVDINTYPWWKKQVEKKQIVYIENIKNLTDITESEHAEFDRQGIKTLLCFPIINNNILMGYFGFDSVSKVCLWNKDQIAVIETLANILADALIKVETEIELIRSKELAEAASVAKSNFLSNMSHEIRTPLNGVIGFTELLRTTTLNKSQREYLENAITSANSLLGVISDILDFSKIESGKMELESVKTDIIQLFENASDIIKVMASNKGLELLLNISPDIPRFAYIDPIRTKQILVNLLSNAVKFTHTGEIELSLNFELVTQNEGIFKVSVRDTGIGIKDSDRHKLFKAFSQADTSTTRRYGGTGLGLIISNSLARQMGSSIEFKSEYGVGTTFSFDIFSTFECGEMLDYKNIKNLNTVLFIDDNANNRSIMELNFEFWKIKFTGAQSGAEALNLLQNGKEFDLIIVDYHMPDMDGLETIRLIRKVLDESRKNQSIIMLHSSSDDLVLHEKAKELNVKYLLTKPVKQDELYYYLNSINSTDNVDDNNLDSNSAIAHSDAKIDANKEICILVAEDTPMNMLVIGNMLHTLIEKVQILEAHNGIEAINVMKINKPDIILMDVQMPELDGLEATRQIRKLKNGLTIPIIALTAGVSKEERELCFKSGMDDFISKPIELNELKRITHKYLNMETLTEKMEKEVFTVQSIRFDREKLISKIGNADILVSLFEMAKTEYPKYIEEIGNAIETGDEKLIKQKAHKIKGSAFNMEFVAMGEIALKMENSASQVAELNVLFEMLNEEWKKLLDELK